MRDPFLWLVCTLIGILVCLISFPYLKESFDNAMESPSEKIIHERFEKEDEVVTNLEYSLSDPEEAPETLKESVMMGYGLMINTQELAQEYVGSSMTCSNCHFAGGNTTGGKNGGLSLAGVAAVYPKHDIRFDRLMDLPARINNCFERSMNGKPLPRDSKEMLALVTYFHWISKGLPVFEPVPWLGLNKLTITTESDPVKGKRVYDTTCAMCHGSHGQGTTTYPPVWGEKSFNTGAGMYQQAILESFVYYNMPKDDPSLSEQEARDVAAYIRQQDRPRDLNNLSP